MTDAEKITYIEDWLRDYALKAKMSGYVIGISGGVDSALTSTLCARTGLDTLLVSMPIRQGKNQLERARNHIQDLESKFGNVQSIEIDLTASFERLESDLPIVSSSHFLAMANTRSRLRMLTLYALAQPKNLLVAGTGNKVEDFGVGFFTKYGDGGVDVSPIADLMKTEVWALADSIGVLPEIVAAAPTDGLFDEERTDEDQLGATYQELEWAMDFSGNWEQLDARQQAVWHIYQKLNKRNQHKTSPIPVCKLPR